MPVVEKALALIITASDHIKMKSGTGRGGLGWHLMKRLPSRVVSNTSGATVMSGVDATRLSKWFGRRKFDFIACQLPNVGSRNPLYGRNPNHVIVRCCMKSATDHLNRNGIVAISAVNNPHYDGAFDVDGASECNEYEIPVVYPFYFSDYPSYTHVKTKDDGRAPSARAMRL
jgi:hypothetical protein